MEVDEDSGAGGKGEGEEEENEEEDEEEEDRVGNCAGSEDRCFLVGFGGKSSFPKGAA